MAQPLRRRQEYSAHLGPRPKVSRRRRAFGIGKIVLWLGLVALLFPRWPYSSGWTFYLNLGILLFGLALLLLSFRKDRGGVTE